MLHETSVCRAALKGATLPRVLEFWRRAFKALVLRPAFFLTGESSEVLSPDHKQVDIWSGKATPSGFHHPAHHQRCRVRPHESAGRLWFLGDVSDADDLIPLDPRLVPPQGE